MNDGIFKWLLIGGAAYLLYEYFQGSSSIYPSFPAGTAGAAAIAQLQARYGSTIPPAGSSDAQAIAQLWVCLKQTPPAAVMALFTASQQAEIQTAAQTGQSLMYFVESCQEMLGPAQTTQSNQVVAQPTLPSEVLAVALQPVTGAKTAAPYTPALPTVPLTSQVGAGAMNALQAIASQPGNVKLSTTGGTTYSGWQWDAMAKAAFGNAYIPLSSIPGVAGATQYSIGGYVQAYLQALQASVQGMSGLGADPRQMSREVRDRLMRQHLNQRATNRPVIHLAPTSRGRIVDKNYWGDGARSKRQIPYTWVQ